MVRFPPKVFFPQYSITLPYLRFTGLLKVLDDIEHFAQTSQDPAALGSVREARAGLEKLIAKMDSLESSFDRIAERSCELRLSLSWKCQADPLVSAVSFAIIESSETM